MIPDDAARNLIRMDARVAAVRAIIANGPLDADELHRRIRRTLGYDVSDADIRASLSSLRRAGIIRLVGVPGRRRIALARDDRVWEEDARSIPSAGSWTARRCPSTPWPGPPASGWTASRGHSPIWSARAW